MRLYYWRFETKEAARSVENRRFCFREALADRLNTAGMSIVDFDYEKYIIVNRNGKPSFSDGPLSSLHFSISHSGFYWACVFHEAAVGLDIEDVATRGRNAFRLERVASRFFSAEELAAVKAAASEEALQRIFYGIWTRKEAFIKQRGGGIFQGLQCFSTIGPSRPGMHFSAPDVGGRFYCAVCTATAEPAPVVIDMGDFKG